MKKLILAVTAAILLLCPKILRADCTWFCGDSTKWKLATQAVLIPYYAYQQLVIHELSHLVIGGIAGVPIEGVKLYPSVTYEGRFVFARVCARLHAEQRYDGYSAMAPALMDIALFTATDIMLNTVVDKHSKAAPYLWMAGMLAPLADLVMYANAQDHHADINVMGRQLGINRTASTIVLDTLAAVALFRLINDGLEIFSDSPEKPEEASSFSVNVTPASVGVSFVW
jgi:hypothetical protein